MSKPAWRPARDAVKEMAENLGHANKAMTAATEWFERGAEGQFLENTLDQMHLCYRFLEETLVRFRRVRPRSDDGET